MSKWGSGWARALCLAVALMTVGMPLTGDRVETVAAATAADRAASPPDVLPAGGQWTVTLITGEVVEVHADAEGRVSAAITEHNGPVRTRRTPEGDLYVIPVAVTPLLVDVLDVELFNVTGLIRQGYDDASTGSVPLIVQHDQGTEDNVAAPLAAADAGQPLPSIGAVALAIPKPATAATGAFLAEASGDMASTAAAAPAGLRRIWLDRRVTTRTIGQEPPEADGRPPRLDPNLTQVGADDAWAAGYTGDGVRVAVLDTGIDPNHPDLVGQIVAAENFSDSPDTVDRFGHGTHVAAIVAGTGAAAAGARRGVAPDADLLVGKVLNDQGWGNESDVIAGMEWAAAQADVVNMSLGDDWPSDGSDPLSQALDALSKQHGTLFVVAAGNAGPTSVSVGSPGAADTALTVGAVDGADAVADFSSRGPLIDSNELKPEVVAPGVDVIAARAAGTAMGQPLDADYTSASGTSMATPHVAGAAAVLAQQHPDWTGEQVKNALVGSADPTGADGFDGGSGRIDLEDGMAVDVLADRDVVDLSLPHPRTAPHLETMTWTNTGAGPETLALSAAFVDRDGTPIDDVSVEPAELTIPAGGSGSATVTVDAAGLADGLYSGTVDAVARSDDADVRAPVGIHAGPETAELTVEVTAHPDAGDDIPFGSVTILNLDDYATFANLDYFYSGHSFTVTVPVGRYAVVGDVRADFDSNVTAMVGDAEVMITEDTTVAFDGRAAVPLVPTVEGKDTVPVAMDIGVVLTPDAGTGGYGFSAEMYSWYPSPPLNVIPLEGDPDNVAQRAPVVRLQAPPITAESGGEPIAVSLPTNFIKGPDAGAHTRTAIDVGDGSDFSGAQDKLAVAVLPADRAERAAISQRALDAGVAVLAFVDESRSVLTLSDAFGPRWAPVPVVGAAGPAASALRAAGQAGQPVTVTVSPSPFVYDLVLPVTDPLDPTPVVTRRDQRRLARLDETYHRDAAVPSTYAERRRALSVSLMELDSIGPLPDERVAYVTPGVGWQSYMSGDGVFAPPGSPFPPMPERVTFSTTLETRYRSGSRQQLEWLDRPIAPGPVGGPPEQNFCWPPPPTRTPEMLHVALTGQQDEPDRFACNGPSSSTLTVERNGTVLATSHNSQADVPVPLGPGDFRVVYEASASAPYAHRSTTTWSFPSAGDPDVPTTPIPMLVVDYDLPLDVLNRPTGDRARLTVRQVTGSEPQRITSVQVWTSIDDGATWHQATVELSRRGVARFDLPDAPAGTGVSLRVAAADTGGSTIDQTLLDAYVG